MRLRRSRRSGIRGGAASLDRFRSPACLGSPHRYSGSRLCARCPDPLAACRILNRPQRPGTLCPCRSCFLHCPHRTLSLGCPCRTLSHTRRTLTLTASCRSLAHRSCALGAPAGALPLGWACRPLALAGPRRALSLCACALALTIPGSSLAVTGGSGSRRPVGCPLLPWGTACPLSVPVS